MIFVAGTDTDAGKTTVTAALLRALHGLGVRAQGIKPVQTGCMRDAAGVLTAPDVTRYQEAAGTDCASALHLYAPACSPHMAAGLAGESLTAQGLAQDCRTAAQGPLCLLEGAGGIHTPLSTRETMLDLMTLLDAPVLLVADNRLGCLNHVLLSLHALRTAGLRAAGLILCHCRPEPCDQEARAILHNNIQTLHTVCPQWGAPLLATLPHVPALAHPASDTRQHGWESLTRLLRPVAARLMSLPPASTE